jgi:hypothetical protein
MKTPYGVSTSEEIYVRLAGGHVLAFPNAETEPGGCSYVRFLAADGGEIVYWTAQEWEEEPESVMGAIMGFLVDTRPMEDLYCPLKYYQFAPDCEFPEGVEFEPYG